MKGKPQASTQNSIFSDESFRNEGEIPFSDRSGTHHQQTCSTGNARARALGSGRWSRSTECRRRARRSRRTASLSVSGGRPQFRARAEVTCLTEVSTRTTWGSVGGSPSPTGCSVVLRQVEAACKPQSNHTTPNQGSVSRAASRGRTQP